MTERTVGKTSGVDTHLILNALNSMAASHARHGLPEDETLFALSDYLSAILPHATAQALTLGVQLTVLQRQLALYAQVRGFELRLNTRCAAGLAEQRLDVDLGTIITGLLDLVPPQHGVAWQVDINTTGASASAHGHALDLSIVLTASSIDGQLPLEAANAVLATHRRRGALLSAQITQRADKTCYNIGLVLQPCV